MLEIVFAKPALPKSGALVLLMGEGEIASGLWQQADEATGGAIERALKVADFKGEKGKTCTILAPGAGLSRVVAVGLGKPSELNPRLLNEAGGHAAAAVAREPAAAVATGALQSVQAAEVALGATLRAYRFDKYRTKEEANDRPKLIRLALLTADPSRAKAAWEPLRSVAKGVFLSRDLVSEPPNVLNPAEMAERCKKLSDARLEGGGAGAARDDPPGFRRSAWRRPR